MAANQFTESRPFVVAISGTSGGGKTTLLLETSKLLRNVACLYFDDYLNAGNDPTVIRAWLEGGANPDEFQTPQLASDLHALTTGNAITTPGGHGVEPAEYILVEEPFGRARSEIAQFIDFAAHLNLPADIALARRIIRAIESGEHTAPEQLLGYFLHDLKTYLAVGRTAYGAAERAARETADLVLEGIRPADELATEIVEKIQTLHTAANRRGTV